jgi:hypothetical protein
MKNIIISFGILLFSMLVFGQSSTYYPIPSAGAIWREYFGGYEVNCRDYQISITGDTLIGDNTYHKLQEFGVIYMGVPGNNCLGPVGSIFNNYIGAFRNDVLGKKVYFVPEGAAMEVLLYDFNLSLNDKLPETYLYNYNQDTSYISQVDSVLIGNEYHSRYQLSTGSQIGYVYLIEGIGSSYGLLAWLYPPFEFGSELLCFKQDSVTVYPDQSYECELVTGMSDPIQENVKFSISPNPVVSGIGVVNMPGLLQYSTLVLLDLPGKEVLRVENIEPGSILHTDHLSQGIYFYRVLSGNKVLFTGKLLIGSK